MRLVLAFLPMVLWSAGLAAQQGVHPEELKLKPKIDKAIADGVEALIESQYRDGTWGQWGRFKGGKTALCAYALLKCGVDAEHPAVRRALLFLEPIQPTETYTVACMLLAYSAAGQDKYRARMQELADLLIEWQTGGGDYGYPNGARDLSNTQYAALGLWTAQKYKIDVPAKAWRTLARATMRYAQKSEWVKLKETGQHTTRNGGKIEVAGFGYRKGHKATGSMTTAGVSILQICKIGLGAKLSGSRRAMDRAIEGGVNWLGQNFAVDKNPGHNGWPFYYLYGLERVGSLLRIEKMGEHWWYVEGAKHLLAKQVKEGHWPGGGQERETRTAFALLFLRRATAGKAAATGLAKMSAAPKHLFVAGKADKHDVTVSASGQQPLSVWVTGFGDALKKRHAQHGLRVVQVEYLDGDHIIGQVAGNPTKAWQFDAFLSRTPALPRGEHKIRARIQLLAADVAPAALQKDVEVAPKTETVLSPEMTVTIRDVFAPWMKEAVQARHSNLVVFKKTKATASSSPKAAKNVCDGKESTQWVCAANDPDPTVKIDLGRAVSARSLMVSQAGSRAVDIGLFDRIKAIEVRINGGKPSRHELDGDQLAITTLSLGKARKVRKLEVRIVERVSGRRKNQAGFTEIALCK